MRRKVEVVVKSHATLGFYGPSELLLLEVLEPRSAQNYKIMVAMEFRDSKNPISDDYWHIIMITAAHSGIVSFLFQP